MRSPASQSRGAEVVAQKLLRESDCISCHGRFIPAIHLLTTLLRQDVDNRDKPGHDEENDESCFGVRKTRPRLRLNARPLHGHSVHKPALLFRCDVGFLFSYLL
ncbi:hypothetical protein ACSVBT_04110 [Afipia sp. TerB]